MTSPSQTDNRPGLTTAERARLIAAGYRITTTVEFLGLTPEEDALIRTRYALTQAIRGRRAAIGISQAELAERIGSGQSRIAKVEKGDPHVSFDLLLRALFATGATPGEVGAIIAASSDAAGVQQVK